MGDPEKREVDKFGHEIMWINGDSRARAEGVRWEEEERGWSCEDSLAYAELVH